LEYWSSPSLLATTEQEVARLATTLLFSIEQPGPVTVKPIEPVPDPPDTDSAIAVKATELVFAPTSVIGFWGRLAGANVKVNVTGVEIIVVEPDIESWIAVTLHDVATKAFNVEPVIRQLLEFALTTENEVGLPFPPVVLRIIDWPTAPERVGLLIRSGFTALTKVNVTASDVTVFSLRSLGFRIAMTPH